MSPGGVLLVTALALPSPALAQCGGERGGLGGFLDSLTSLFRASKSEFEFTRNGVKYSGEIEVKDATCGMTTVAIRGTAALGSGIELKRGVVGAQIEGQVGAASEIEVTLPNSHWNNASPIDVFDPSSLPPGSTAILRREFFASAEMEASYRALVVAAGYEVGSGVVVAVQKTEDGRVRLMVGPYEVVRNESFFGVGAGPVKVGLGRDDKLETGTVRQWTFDPNNPDDLRSYRLALLQGTMIGGVPFTNRPSDRVEYATYESAAGARLEAGPFKFGGSWGASNGDVRVTTRADGTKTYEGVFNYNGTILNIAQDYDAAGRPVGQERISVAFTNISDWNAYMLDVATGRQPLGNNNWEGGGAGGRKLEITEENWREWRDRARAWVNDPRRIGSPPVHIDMIANAQGPRDVAMALYRVASGPYTRTFEDLFTLSTHQGNGNFGDPRALPGAAGAACPNGGGGSQPTGEAMANQVAQRWCGANVTRSALTTPTATVADARQTPAAAGAGIARD